MSAQPLPEHHPFRSAEARERYHAHYKALSEAWPLESEVRMVETDAGVTHVRIHGPEDGPPLVLFNGTWCHTLQWPPEMIAKFSRTYRTYLPDMLYEIGMSVSARPRTSVADYTAWLDGLFDALELKQGVNLFGISRGAWIAAEYLLHAPERLGKAVWLSPALTVQKASWKNVKNGWNSVAAFVKPTSRTVGAMMRTLMPEMERNDKAGFDEFVAEMLVGLECFSGIKEASLGPRLFSDAELAGISIPVLYIAGEDEMLSSVKGAVARLARVAPSIETTVFPNAGHALITVQTEAVGDRVLQFLGA